MKITKGRAEFMELTEAIRIAMDREAMEEIVIDRPNYSQRVMLVNK